jgi:hypothetical protein
MLQGSIYKKLMKSPCVIRPVRSGDLNFLLQILEECKDEIPLKYDLFTDRLEKFREHVGNTYCENNKSLVATDNNNIVGSILINENDSYVNDNNLDLAYIIVKKTERRRGIFSQMLNEAKKYNHSLSATVKHTNKSCMSCLLLLQQFERDREKEEKHDSALKELNQEMRKEDYFLWKSLKSPLF